MNDSFITPFKVGLVVLAAILATMYMVTMLTRGEGWGRAEGYQVYAVFDDVTGLAKNSRVMMSGIPIGTLEDFELEGSKVRVVMTIRSNIKLYEGIETEEGYYRNGATVQKTQASVIGDYFLEVTPGTQGRVLEDGDEIKNVTEAIGPSQLFTKFDRIASDIEQITQSLSAVFGGRKGAQSLEQMMTDLQQILGTLRRFTDANSEKIDRIVSNAEGISEDVERMSATSTESVSRIKIGRASCREIVYCEV